MINHFSSSGGYTSGEVRREQERVENKAKNVVDKLKV
jgi:hypothetical protein